MRRWVGPLAAGGLVVARVALGTAFAFSYASVGDQIENAVLHSVEGAEQPLLGAARVNVFVFVDPAQEHSVEVLKGLAKLEVEFANKPVRWVAVVSDAAPMEASRALGARTGIRMPVLIDRGDAVYGRLGVRVLPAVGIADAEHRLLVYQPFAKVNLLAVLRAHIQRQLGEIDEAQLARALEPEKGDTPDASASAAGRWLTLARSLVRMNNLEKALESVDKSIAIDGSSAAAHVLRGRILVERGRCAEAKQAFDRGLALDASIGGTEIGEKCRPK